MAKRQLGLGKAAKAKKQKTAPAAAPAGAAAPPETELTVELAAEVDANDAIAQLAALWANYAASADKSELVLNGIVHECDRILRKAHSRAEGGGAADDGEKIELTGDFYAIYAMALSSLGIFHAEEPAKVAEFFAAATERLAVGKAAFPACVALLFAEARIHINDIPVSQIRRLTVDSRVGAATGDVARRLDACLAMWEAAEAESERRAEYTHYNAENSDFLQALDDLLDMVDHFGRAGAEGQDSDSEDDGDAPELPRSHPLHAIRHTDKYNLWWREHTQRFLANLDRGIDGGAGNAASLSLRRELCKRLGQSLLMEAETPTNIFTTLTYYKKSAGSIDGLTREQARGISQDLLTRALEHLKAAQDDDEPDSWAAVAEAMISLGNTYDLDSAEQEHIYEEAEAILTRANNATNGRYDKVLENLQG